jgi:hypothetical protein
MSGSGRSQQPKARLIGVAVAALFLAIASLSVGLWQQSEYKGEADQQARKYASYANYHVRHTCGAIAKANKADCIAQTRHEQRAYESNEQDLYAQKTTAAWTALMGGAAIIGMILSAVGVFLVWTTFSETKRANEISVSANKEMLRAYVTTHHAGPLEAAFRKPFEMQVGLVNTGQTPALHVDGFWIFGVFPPSQIIEMPKLMERKETGNTVGRDGLFLITKSLGPFSKTMERKFKSGELVLYAVGHMRYKDIFGDWWVVEFDYVNDKDITTRRMDFRRNGSRIYPYPEADA